MRDKSCAIANVKESISLCAKVVPWLYEVAPPWPWREALIEKPADEHRRVHRIAVALQAVERSHAVWVQRCHWGRERHALEFGWSEPFDPSAEGGINDVELLQASYEADDCIDAFERQEE